jgi:hypothetical protein
LPPEDFEGAFGSVRIGLKEKDEITTERAVTHESNESSDEFVGLAILVGRESQYTLFNSFVLSNLRVEGSE